MFNWLKKLFVGEEKPASGVRARGPKGRYKADDKSTPDVNEAYVDGKTPKRKPRKKAAPKKAPAKRGRPRKNAKK
jgi:hypothetical protein|tara:strand:+ start:986 stop:1210 length:225 start_codon:yes stop_codon:yes gene_type:complete